MRNRRRTQRYRIRKAGIIVFEQQSAKIETVNLSLNGVRVATDTPLLEGAAVSVKLHIPELGGNFTVNGTVVWCQEGFDVGFEAGIEISPSQDDALGLGTYLETLETSS